MMTYKEFLPDNIIALTTDNSFDFSQNPKNPGLNSQQKKILTEFLRLKWDKEIHIRQVHSNRIVSVDDVHAYAVEEADGIITNLKDIPICIRTADCLPVFLFEQQANCIGLVHCGWRSTYKKILLKAIIQMVNDFACDVRKIKVVFGPSLRSCCYEVGSEFFEYFSPIQERRGKYYFDLCGENQRQVEATGIPEGNIFDSRICTCCDNQYFSFRREGEKSGRMISMMMVKS